ncbi:NDT80 like DNA-binding family [Cordyceps militaris]|uniref:NDT80 like DNA-binding family n=1 Tax=Cordyceps militaris TaxID=73501 RepID=A0A2H4SMG4_CORMI|nr:NDT80 like DNA-binding family [Cordyceps militaris]
MPSDNSSLHRNTTTGADHPYRHTQSQPMSTRERYSTSTPQHSRRAETNRHRAVSSSYHTTVMSPGPAYGGNEAAMSNYPMQQEPPREHSVSPGYNPRAGEELNLPMGVTEQFGDLHYMNASMEPQGPPIDVNLSTQCHKNFFMGDKFFTCYRRNYMACNVSYSLTPYYAGAPMFFTPMSATEMPAPVKGFAMCISAIVAEHQHQEVVLLQHTPKRDKGPVTPPKKIRLAPKSRHLSGQPPHIGVNFHDRQPRQTPDIYGSHTTDGILATEHNFDRIQFKMATANNGERRAGQQRCFAIGARSSDA